MDGLKTDINGGFPFTLDDIRWFDFGIREAMKAIFSNYSDGSTSESFVISGVYLSSYTQSGTTYVTSTPGWVYLNGEICFHPGDGFGVPVTAGKLWFELSSGIYDSGGTKVFENGQTHETHELRRALMSSGATTPADAYEFSAHTLDPRRLDDLIAQRIVDSVEGHQVVGAPGNQPFWGSGNFDSTTLNPGFQQLSYFKDAQGMVHVTGYLYAQNNAVVFVLPVDYRPASDVLVPVHSTSPIGQTGYIKVATDGKCTVYRPYDGANYTKELYVIDTPFQVI